MPNRQRNQAKEEGEHEVNITITIAKCSPAIEKDPDPKKAENIHVQNYFHCQYKLLPDDKGYVNTDVVTFGDAAKLYADNDSKVLRVWVEGKRSWVVWSSSRRVRVTRDALLRMFNHKCEMKFWDTKDKVSAKARFDRPKAFRLPAPKAPDEVDLDSVRSLLSLEGKINMYLGLSSVMNLDRKGKRLHGASIISQSTIDEELSDDSTDKRMDFNRKQSKLVAAHSSSTSKQYISTTDSKLNVKVRLDKNKQPEFKNLISLASTGEKPLPVDTEETEFKSETDGNQSKYKGKTNVDKGDVISSLMGKDYVSDTEKITQDGLGSVSVSLKTLFTNCKSISSCLKHPVGSVEEVILVITLDEPLLSEIQGDNLNPMTLTVGTATQMPNNGLSFDELSSRCIPPHIKYKFHDAPAFISDKKMHAKDLVFNEHNVILLGVMSKELLREFLLGPPLKVEIHDRDPKESLKKKAGIFGSQPEDDEISNVSFANCKRNDGYEKSYDINFGIAEFDLSELLKGEKILTLVSPIRCFSRSSCNEIVSVSKTKGYGIPPGDYLEFGSELKIKIELSKTLVKNRSTDSIYQMTNIPADTNLVKCPFNRMIYIFDYKNKPFMKKIINEINEINATALDLLSYPPHVISVALSTYKLTDQQKEDKTLDIITGCQIIDGMHHIFILEGLSGIGIRRIWDKMEHPQFNEDSIFRVLYNSSMSFSQRIYLSLDVDLIRVSLHQPLANIVKQPLLYIRDIIPNPCFQAVTKLFQLTQCTSLHNAVRNEFFPEAEMIVSLAKEFGVPINEDDYHENENVSSSAADENTCEKPESSNVKTTSSQCKVKLHSEPLNMKNPVYEDILDKRIKSNIKKDYIQSNIKSLLTLSKSRPKQQTVSSNTNGVAHNYSTQHLNTTAMAKDKLRQVLAEEDGSSRYTYCDRYNTATVVPVSVDKTVKEENELSKSKWQTNNGFIFPGFKSSLESNQHPIQIDPARKDELYIPWRENILHRNVVKPCVDRISFEWEDRHLNFDTMKNPPEYFGKPAPVTIHAAGDRLENEKMLARLKEERKWREKLVVDDNKFHHHRCSKQTELMERGAHSSNQEDRLKDILKDEPQKLSLKKRGMNLAPIPALSVVSYPQVDTHLRKTGHDLSTHFDNDSLEKNVGFNPGEVEGKSWLFDINTIPINDYKHKDFEATKGQEFRLVHTDRERTLNNIKPLTPLEKDNHLFLVK